MIKTGKLKNGLRYVIKERKDLNSTTVCIWIKTGTAYEEDNIRGIAHFLEHMMFNGSINMPPGAIDREVEVMGGEINAATSYDYTYYYINVPYIHTKRAVELLGELVLNPLLSEEMVEKEKPIVLEEIARSKDNPQDVFYEKLMENLYENTPYQFPILGFEETVKTFNANQVRRFYEENYTPERMVLSVVGNCKIQEIEGTIKAVWENFTRTSKTNAQLPIEVIKNEYKEFTVHHPAVQLPQIVISWKLPPCSRDDVYYEILESFLSSGKSSFLYNRIREKGYAYSCYSNYQNLVLGSNFSIGATTENIESCLKEIRKSIEEVLSITEEEFEFAKRKLLKNEIFSRESGETEADNIGYAWAIIEDEDYYLKYIEDIKKAEFKTFLKKISFLSESPTVGILLP